MTPARSSRIAEAARFLGWPVVNTDSRDEADIGGCARRAADAAEGAASPHPAFI
jgi:hypothetical protein